MRKSILALLCVVFAASSFSQETAIKRTARRGEAAGYSTRDATVLSMVGWGVGLAVGIATLCVLMDNNSSSSGGNSHAH